jgi:uncharacterized SAM-binding protein YcdF (DUF218 family)
MRRGLIRLAVGAFVGGLFLVGYTTWRIWDEGSHDDRRASDAIVVLGAAQYNGRPSPVFQARLDHAIELYHDGVAPILVVTGGKLPGDRTTEAAAARVYAVAHNVPDDAILVEDRGRTTLESLRSVGDLLHERRLSSAGFVSDRTHMLRVLRIARDEGVDAHGSPTATSPTDATFLARVESTIHEVGALGIYFVAGTGP